MDQISELENRLEETMEVLERLSLDRPESVKGETRSVSEDLNKESFIERQLEKLNEIEGRILDLQYRIEEFGSRDSLRLETENAHLKKTLKSMETMSKNQSKQTVEYEQTLQNSIQLNKLYEAFTGMDISIREDDERLFCHIEGGVNQATFIKFTLLHVDDSQVDYCPTQHSFPTGPFDFLREEMSFNPKLSPLFLKNLLSAVQTLD